ncbi:MAG: ATP-binding protein [Pseudomonadota bacterium]
MLSLVVLGILVAAGLGATGVAARAVDKAVLTEELNLVARTLQRRSSKIVEDVASATVWDDAYVNIVTRFDPDWADENFGVYYANYMGHDRTIVFGPGDRVVYASDGGEATTPDALRAFAADVSPFVARMRLDEARLPAGGRPGHSLDGVLTDSLMLRADGGLWLVALSTVIPENPDVVLTGGPTAIVVSARRIDAGFMKTLEDDLGIDAPHLLGAKESGRGLAIVPIADRDGQVLGRLGWTPRRPGMHALVESLGPLLLVLAAFIVAVAALARRVHAALRNLASHEARMEATLTELTEARDRAEAANVAKSQFLANISHEIRTPMNGVLGMAQIMDRGDLSPDQRSHLAVIRESGATLLALLNDLLDLAKIEAGKLEIDRTDTDLTGLVSGVCGGFMVQAADKKLKLGFAIEPSAGGAWKLDGLRLSQVLGNLISNAVKFTDRGHVSVRVWNSRRGLEFAVLDTGAGIPAERIGDLFGKFNQLDASTTRKFGGTGLGLAICRELVELMGGEIAVESAVGEGSYFSFFVPAEPGETRAAA